MKQDELTALNALSEMAAGRLSSEELLCGYLEQVDKREGEVGAWASLDRAGGLEQARQADVRRKSG